MTNKQIATATVRLILGDLTDRSGLQNAWDEIDSDIQREIKATWSRFIETALERSALGKPAE